MREKNIYYCNHHIYGLHETNSVERLNKTFISFTLETALKMAEEKKQRRRRKYIGKCN